MRKFSAALAMWPGLALGIVFALGAQVAFADPAELRIRSRELTCRESSKRLIRISVETTLLENVPCKRIVMKDAAGQPLGRAHTVWGCSGRPDHANGVVRYDFDINDWPASLTVQGENAILEKNLRAFLCSSGVET
ncbi:MAG TPA: hypothetical protein VM598_01995 [Bdellovibrionota bacterium]|nr:hypothetical protein [Bdellovibrionota bacterium]